MIKITDTTTGDVAVIEAYEIAATIRGWNAGADAAAVATAEQLEAAVLAGEHEARSLAVALGVEIDTLPEIDDHDDED